jgi:hypothetical protein
MRNSVLSKILILLVLSSCTSLRPAELSKADPSRGNCMTQGSKVASPLRGRVDKAIFRGSLEVRGHHLTGLLYLKKMPDSTMRLAFTNEFGMTWFDLILNQDVITVEYCFEPMNKKSLLKIFKTNFELLFNAEADPAGFRAYSQKPGGNPVIRSRYKNYRTWFVLDSSDCRTLEIRGKSSVFDKTVISCTGYRDGVPDSLTILSPVIHMKMELVRDR